MRSTQHHEQEEHRTSRTPFAHRMHRRKQAQHTLLVSQARNATADKRGFNLSRSIGR